MAALNYHQTETIEPRAHRVARRWFVDSAHKADAISGFGVALAFLGIFVAAQPVIRAGVMTTARWQFGLGEEITSIEEADASRRVFKERVYGVMLIAIGTLLNGYALAIREVIRLARVSRPAILRKC